jgi:hypothetical protein
LLSVACNVTCLARDSFGCILILFASFARASSHYYNHTHSSSTFTATLSNPRILYNISSCYTFILKNRVVIVAKLVLINVYSFTLILISVHVFILSLLLLIVYKKVKESPLSNWLRFTLHKSILYNPKVKTSFKGYRFPTPQVLGLPSTS